MKLYPTVAQAYVAESGNIRTKNSRDSYRKVMRLLQSVYPGKEIHQFTAEDLTTFCVSRYDGQKGHAAPSTQKNRRAHIRSTFEWATWKKIISHNPALELKFTVRPGNGQVRAGTWLDRDSIVKALSLLDTDEIKDQRDRMVLLVGVFTGLRCFELAGLTWNQFSRDLTELTLKGKGDKIATIGVPPELQEELERWRTFRQIGGTAVFPSFKQVYHPVKRRRVHVVNWDTPLGVSGLAYSIKRIAELIGVHFTPHDMRRSFGGLLEESGVPLKDVQNAMRHENLATTDKYLSKNPARTVAVTKGFRLGL